MNSLFNISSRFKSGKYNLSDLYSRVIFWDVKMEDLSINRDKDFIIQRVLSRHMNKIENLENLEKLYSKNSIKSYAKNSSEIFGNENIEFVASRYRLNPRGFKKYLPNIKHA
jgi:hypothetical protein